MSQLSQNKAHFSPGNCRHIKNINMIYTYIYIFTDNGTYKYNYALGNDIFIVRYSFDAIA